MRYVIFGAGAIGGGIGGLLHVGGHEVILIARGAHLEAIRREGLYLRTPTLEERLPIPAVGHPSEIAWRGDEVVLLTMKTQDTLAALDALRDAAGSGVPVVCAQNGVENERMAARRFEHVYGMLIQMPATHLEAGEVLVYAHDAAGVLDAGAYPSGVDVTIEATCAALRSSDFAAEPNTAIMRLKYAKLLNNLGNVVQAICGHGVDARGLLRVLRREALDCYRAAGIDCASAEEFNARASLLRAADPITAGPRAGGSTWQSLARGAGSLETDYLNGEITWLGVEHGVPTPANRLVQQLAARALRERLQPGFLTPAEVLATLGAAS